ncbi:MAG: murein biosynthesis integral membrane protein MurJ [Candidatus Gastranaerophilales bacterium]|nr:murein biosynthesis integral membrane protein MurJ [Candidatus Gastranaerophilales bacterium]
MSANITSNNEKKAPSVLRAAWLIAVVTIVSKLIGFVRDVVIANCYGASTVSDAYFYAYQLPALAIILLGGVGGPFHSATVAVFSKIIPSLKEKANSEVNSLFNTFLTASFIFFAVFALLCFVFSDQIMRFIISGNNPELLSLASLHLKIMSPVLIVGGIVGIYYGILISYREFILPNVSPILMSVVIIAMITLVKHDNTGIVLAWATTIGAMCQFVYQLPKIRQLGFRLRPNFDFNNIHFHQICELLFPAVLSSTIGQVYIYVDMFFASALKEGAWTAIGYSNRVFQFPVGILVTAFLVPLFPIFSKLVNQSDFNSIRRYFNKGVGVLFFASFPIIIGVWILGYDGIKLIFEHGAFDDRATFMVTQALWFLAFSILPYVFRDSITRVYYSFNDSATPFLIALCSIVLKVFLNWLLVVKLAIGSGIGGITLSTSLVTLFNACVLGILIKKKIELDYKSLFLNFGKMLLAGGITFFVCWGMAIWFNQFFATLPTKVFELTKIISIGFLCIACYIFLNLLYKMDYAIELKDRLLAKIKQKIR